MASLCNEAGITSGCWIGLNTLKGVLTFVDGSSVKNIPGFDSNGDPITSINPWYNGQPDRLFGIEKCVQIYYGSGLMNDNQCHSQRLPLCMKNPAKACSINNDDLQVWLKGSLDDISNSNGIQTVNNIKGFINENENDCSIYGDISTEFNINYGIDTNDYTIIYGGRYTSELDDTSKRERIINGENANYLVGFDNNRVGVSYQGQSITEYADATTNNDWLISTAYPNKYRKNGVDISNGNQAWTQKEDPDVLYIGVNNYNSDINSYEPSNYGINELMIFDKVLTVDQMECIENYMSQEHNILIANYTPIATPFNTQTCGQPELPPYWSRYKLAQCHASTDNPIFGIGANDLDHNPKWNAGDLTFDECRQSCLTSVDEYGRKCIGIEFGDNGIFNDDDPIYCAHVWACDEILPWTGGSVYLFDELNFLIYCILCMHYIYSPLIYMYIS